MAVNKEIIEVIVKGAKKSKKQLGGVNASLVSMAKKAGLAAGAYFGARGLIEGFKQLTLQGSKLQNVSKAFDNMGKQVGFTTAAMQKFRAATNNTVDDIELMTKANNAMALGIVENEDQFANLLDTAQRLGAALGQETGPALDSLVTGMGRQSKLMLDNLGIMVDTQGAYEDYADILGVTVSELTESEKKTAFNNAAMAEANRIVGEMGPETETANMKMQELGVTFSNMTADLGKALSPALENLTSKFVVAGMAVADFMREQTEDETQTAIRNLKEMGVDTRELELAYTSLQKNKALQILGNQLTENVANTERITAANIKMESLEEEKLAHAQESLNLQERIMNVTGGEITLQEALAEAENKNTSRQKDQTVLLIERLQREQELFNEKQVNYDLDIEALDKEIEKRQDLIALRIQEEALSVSTAETENKNIDDTIKGDEKAAKFKEKIDAVMLKNKGKVKEEILKHNELEKSGDIKEAFRNAWGIGQDAYKWGTKLGGPLLGAITGAAGLTAGLAYAKNISGFATGADYVTSGKELIMVGDNPSGQERVQVTPLGGDPNVNGPQGGMTINIQGSIIGTEQFTEDILMPQIEEGLRLGNRI